MDFFVKEIVTQVLSLYNYTPDFHRKNKPKITSISDPNVVKDKFLIKSDGNFCLLVVEFTVRADGGYKKISLNMKIPRMKNCFNHANFIGMNCIKVVKALIYAYTIKSVDKSILISVIEKTIEESIIAIMLGNKQPNALSDPLVDRISMLLRNLSAWSNRTYEGRKVPFSLIIDAPKAYKKIENFQIIESFLKDDASALLTDGITSYLSISDKIEYKIANYCDAENLSRKIPLVPYRFTNIANVCSKDKIGIILTVQGDVLFIKQTKLVFAKRNGLWHFYDYGAFNSALFNDMPGIISMPSGKDNIRKIYISCLDTAFARTGGCLCIFTMDNLDKVKKDVRDEDIHKPYYLGPKQDEHKKRFMLEDVVINKKTFYTLGRKAIQEIMGIDGATIISPSGDFLTTGAIINNQTNKKIKTNGGARTKIAIKLSKYGIAIKVSADGYFKCYKNQKHIF